MITDKKEKEEHEKTEQEFLESGKFYFINSKFDEAAKEFEKVLIKNINNSEAYCNLGLIYENKKDFVKAKQMYNKTLELDKENKVAKEHISKITGMENE